APLNHDVAPAGPERHPGRVGEQVHTRQDALAGLLMKQHELSWHRSSPSVPGRARIPLLIALGGGRPRVPPRGRTGGLPGRRSNTSRAVTDQGVITVDLMF